MPIATATVMSCHVGGPAARPLDVVADSIVRGNGTIVVKSPDAVTATFAASGNALTTAVDVQRLLQDRAPEAAVRTGISAGDLMCEGDECSGPPVVAADRLRAIARDGQIVIDQAVRWLAGARADMTFEPLRPLGTVGVDGLVDT